MSRSLRRASIRWRLVAIVFLVLAVSLPLAGAGMLLYERSAFERDLERRMTVLADVIGDNSVAALAFNDLQALADTLAALRNDPRIVAGGLYGTDGRLLAQYRRSDADAAPPAETPALRPNRATFARGMASMLRPIEHKGKTAGIVYLVADTSDWTELLARFLAMLGALFGAALVVGMLVSIGLQRFVTGPIAELAALMRRIGRTGEAQLRAVKRSDDEIGVLVDGFNDMLDEIAKGRAELEAARAELQQRVAALDAEVAERRRAEAELHRSRDQLRSFIDNAHVGINWLAPDGTILWANRYELELYGYRPEEYIGRAAAAFHEDPRAVADILARLAGSDVLDGYESRVRCKDGSLRDVIINCSVHREDGRLVHVRCFTRDITERKRAEERLRRSEERYRTLVAATTSVVFGTNAVGRVTERLPSWEEYTGQTWPGYAGARWARMVHRDDRRRLWAAWVRATREGRLFEAEVRIWHARSGRHRYCLARAVPQRRADGEVYEWLGTMLDIDDRKRAEEQFRSAIESAPNAMIMIDELGRIVLVNRRLETLFGYRREELLGRPIETLLPERVRQVHPALRGEFLLAWQDGAGTEVREMSGRHRSGREIPLEVGCSALQTEEGVFCLASMIDITERLRAEEERRRYTEELQRSNRELGQFAYVASHDLQEPLRAMSGCVQLLAQRYRDKLDARANELIEHTVSGALRMQALINDLLAYSRVSTRARPFEPCRLEEPLRQALANLEASLKETGATVTYDPLPTATVDATQLTQLFQNLIGNAIKFHADRPPRVHVSVRRRGGAYLFAVEDNGIGIEPQYIDRIFGVFQRLHTRGKYPGNGIGLAICRKIVERHNGRIWAESVPGKGSTFYFTLPAGTVVHNEEHSELYGNGQH
ncbi:MAG TPA: PAS domain S-box protein [Burkholderiales bacterium]